MPFFDIYGGSDGAVTILTSKYSGSTSSISKMVDFGPPGAEKLFFSDKTSACLNDCSPKPRQIKSSATPMKHCKTLCAFPTNYTYSSLFPTFCAKFRFCFAHIKCHISKQLWWNIMHKNFMHFSWCKTFFITSKTLSTNLKKTLIGLISCGHVM